MVGVDVGGAKGVLRGVAGVWCPPCSGVSTFSHGPRVTASEYYTEAQ